MQGIIIAQEKALGKLDGMLEGLVSDVTQIKARVNNGLATEIAQLSKNLAVSISESKSEAIEIKADVASSAQRLRGENWLGRIADGSLKKIIGIGIGYMILNAVVTSGAVQFVKEKYNLEVPGQQKQILQKQVEIQSTLAGYHYHTLADGRVLQHSGDATKPAWILDSKTNIWEKAPMMRTEEGIKQ
jgi:hypothetical protein